jgi:hypothetical protein
VDLHHLLLAGFDRRTIFLEFRNKHTGVKIIPLW